MTLAATLYPSQRLRFGDRDIRVTDPGRMRFIKDFYISITKQALPSVPNNLVRAYLREATHPDRVRSDDLGDRGSPDAGESAAGNVVRAGTRAQNLLCVSLFQGFSQNEQ